MPITHKNHESGVLPIKRICSEHYIEKIHFTRWPLLNRILSWLHLLPRKMIQTDVIYLGIEGSGLFLLNGLPMKLADKNETHSMYYGLNVVNGMNVIDSSSGHHGPAHASCYSGVDTSKL